ncbi:MAG: ribosomal RNA small subunit methyltransferase A [Candidatus Altiarchaeota archaeon]|nr:ribosomal RNA small subunit methyltransferase A [Candidatus Altiarchaeota archaeon]
MGARLDQHFMVDEDALRKICGYAKLEGGDTVLEVGAGQGALTVELSKRAKVIAVEKGGDLSRFLRKRFAGANVQVVEGDVLKIDLPKFNKFVSNIPYSISKKILLKLIQEDFEVAVLVVQKEVAEKIVAKPGNKRYGVLAVAIQSQAKVEMLDVLPRNVFKPQPRVTSSIVRITRFKEPVEKGFLDFITGIFQQRNKLIRKAVDFEVGGKYSGRRVSTLSPDELSEIYSKNG